MKNNETLYKALFESSSEGILISEDSGRYVDANPEACSLLGMRRESIIGRFVENFADPKRLEEVRKSWLRFLDQGEQKGLFRIYRPDGTTRHVHFFSKAHVLPGLNMTLLRDITERDQAERTLRDNEDRLRRALEDAQKATRAKSQFLANISHEIRTPINGILGSAELLQQTTLSTEQKEYVDMMNDSGKTLLALVQDLLDFSRGEAGKVKLDIQNFDLPALIDFAVATITDRARDKKIKVSVNIQRGITRMRFGDPVRLRQVLTNLLGNAVKFTPRGRIRITVTRGGRSGEAGILKFGVHDSGPGISRKNMKLLFKPFSQADSSATRSHGGTGLGLAISKQLVELMGGTLGVSSAVGKGSQFWFILPLRKSLEKAVVTTSVNTPDSAEAPKATQLGRILIVEDNRINRQVIQRQLNKLGYSLLTTVQNGLEAVKALQNGAFDLVLMDCQMPRMDGYQASALIRKKTSNDRLPIIAMTAHALEEDRDKCLAAGMDDYISKPIRLSTLSDTLKRWLNRGASVESTPEAASSTDEPIDVQQLSQVISLTKQEKDPLLAEYFGEIQECLKRLEHSLQNRASDQVSSLAHGALGASRMLGMKSIAEHFARLETLGNRGELAQAPACVAQAREALQQSQKYLQTLLYRKA